MSDRLFFWLAGLSAMALISFALVWPQGLGARSPRPFGHTLGPVESDQPPSKKALRRRLPSDVPPDALTAPIPLPAGSAPTRKSVARAAP